jgi:hypothetical protein
VARGLGRDPRATVSRGGRSLEQRAAIVTATMLIGVWSAWVGVILLVLALCRAAADGERAPVSCEALTAAVRPVSIATGPEIEVGSLRR